MRILLIVLVLGAFLCVLFLNFYFRIRVFKAYKYLVQNRVEFNTKDIFSNDKIEEIVKKYPQHTKEIYAFMNNIRRSVQLASILIILITAFTAILMFMGE